MFLYLTRSMQDRAFVSSSSLLPLSSSSSWCTGSWELDVTGGYSIQLSRCCCITCCNKNTGYSFTLHTITSICIFSILFSIHFPRCWEGEFVYQTRAFLLIFLSCFASFILVSGFTQHLCWMKFFTQPSISKFK